MTRDEAPFGAPVPLPRVEPAADVAGTAAAGTDVAGTDVTGADVTGAAADVAGAAAAGTAAAGTTAAVRRPDQSLRRPAPRKVARRPWSRSQERLALLYNEQGMRPDEIAHKLGLSSYNVTQIILTSRNRGKL
jgi:hypothetical protein